jgi:hypothetical protein
VALLLPPWGASGRIGARLGVLLVGSTRTVFALPCGPKGGEPETLGEADVLDGGTVLPGFRLPVAEIFAE